MINLFSCVIIYNFQNKIVPDVTGSEFGENLVTSFYNKKEIREERKIERRMDTSINHPPGKATNQFYQTYCV